MTAAETLRVAVDRREGDTIVVVADDGRAFDVRVAELPKPCRAEGAVLDVPLKDGAPQWKRARRNHAEEGGRLKEAGERIIRMRKRDPGGDVEL